MRFDPEPHLAGLKPFQRDTVEYVYGRFYSTTDPVDRFLVADEVGLGKTMVAKGVIAKIIERHLCEPGRRIDIVYVCSNQAIAQQNFSKLAIVGRQRRALTDRITTLPIHIRGLNEHVPGFDRGINIIPITPTTSLDLRSNVGRVDERALMWRLLSHDELLGTRTMKGKGALRVFMPPVWEEQTFKDKCAEMPAGRIDSDLWQAFIDRVRQETLDDRPIIEELLDLADAFRRSERRTWSREWSGRRTKLVGQLRRALAASCVHALEPDLVILDEFQRFPKLLQPGEPTGELAEQLFTYPDCKTLLLSATPYRMYSRAHELEESHHTEFMTTTAFLLNDERRSSAAAEAMAEYRQALRAISEHGRARVEEARDRVRQQLHRVMCRTERLGAAGDRNGMLQPAPRAPLRAMLATTDLHGFAELEHVARTLKTRDVVEFWKSSPYPLNLMDDYALTRAFTGQAKSAKPLPVRYRLDAGAVRRYNAVDPGNARLRGLIEQLDDEGAWKCLWLPPSLAYYTASRPYADVGLFTKRLIFSAWQVVPKAIAALTSYHIDRRILAHAGQSIDNSQEGRRSLGTPLQWRVDGALTEVLLVSPGRELARITDPLALARDRGGMNEAVQRTDVVADAERAVRQALKVLELPNVGGREDLAWYVVALLRLDEAADPGSVRRWLRRDALGTEEGYGVWARHVSRLERALTSNEDLGAVPRDLTRVLAYVGIAGPGVCAVRALQRNVEADPGDLESGALRVANGLRLMLNLPESVSIVRGFATRRSRIQTRDAEVYWRAALDYCVAGNLQAVLDEYVHVLGEWAGGSDNAGRLDAIVSTATEAIGVQAASLNARDIAPDGRLRDRPVTFRSRFSLRFGRGEGEDQQAVHRVDTVRKAFNSPFWPFVVATTSIGQEGLDFHLYSHAVVHWNLPHNPVDLEQREGRVHRYKNHAVRRNIAAVHRAAGVAAAPSDPWEAMFQAAPPGDGGLRPFWIFHGEDGRGAQIERHVPAEPMSIDRHRLTELVRLMGIYRLAFGQPRQDELLAALEVLGGVERPEELVIDLAPPPRPGHPRL